MKISAWHKNNGDQVEFAVEGAFYDKIYVSKIFTESKEPDYALCNTKKFIKGGSGYDLENKLPYEIEHAYPDYNLYPELTKDTAYGILTRGCPRLNHTFCITPKKDGCKAVKVADLDEFWNGQKNIVLLDQNILACKDRIDLLNQLKLSKAKIEFNGGMDVRFLNEEIIYLLRDIKVKDYHFAWDDPKEDLKGKFQMFKDAKIKSTSSVGVYCLVNYWSTIEEDLYRIYTLREMGYMPYVMIYDRQKFVDSKGRWHKGVDSKFSRKQLIHFKICQHMQRWANNRMLIKACPKFGEYEPYKKWVNAGMKMPF